MRRVDRAKFDMRLEGESVEKAPILAAIRAMETGVRLVLGLQMRE